MRWRVAVGWLIALAAPLAGGVRSTSALRFEEKRNSAAPTTYVRLVLDDFSIPAGTVVTCADYQLNIPDAKGIKGELWPAPSAVG